MSIFAEALRALLDDYQTTRAEWAEILNIDEEAIDHWITDQAMPKAEVLRGLMAVLINDSRVPRTVIDDFKALFSRPVEEVTSFDYRVKLPRIGPTIGHYIVSPIRQAFLRTLDTLTPELQEQVLFKAAELCRDSRGDNQ